VAPEENNDKYRRNKRKHKRKHNPEPTTTKNNLFAMVATYRREAAAECGCFGSKDTIVVNLGVAKVDEKEK